MDDATNGAGLFMVLHDGSAIPADLYARVRGNLELRVSVLKRHRTYTAKQMSGWEFWKQLSASEQRMAGRIIAHLVQQAQVPLIRVQKKHEYPYYYELR